MNNFFKFSAIDPVPLLLSVYQKPDMWDKNTIRQDFEDSPHDKTKSIIFRFQEIREDVTDFLGDVQCYDTPEYAEFPEAKKIIMQLMARVQGTQLGRCMIVNLPAGAVVAPHEDQGSSAWFYDRYHVVLQANPGVKFTSGDETVQMVTGEIWWFDNTKLHTVVNDSGMDRIHMIVDIKS